MMKKNNYFRKRTKEIICIILFLSAYMIFYILGKTSSKADETNFYSGVFESQNTSCSVTYSYNTATTTLTISCNDGSGNIPDFEAGSSPPWYNGNYYTNITKVVIKNNIATIGSHAFDGCSNLSYIVIESPSLPTLNERAFSNIASYGAVMLNGSIITSSDASSVNIVNALKTAGIADAWFNSPTTPSPSPTQTPIYVPTPKPSPTSLDQISVTRGKVNIISNNMDNEKLNPYKTFIKNAQDISSLLNLTSNEKEAGCNVWLDFKKTDDNNLDKDELNIIKNQSKQKAVFVGMTFDISLFKKSIDDEPTPVHQTNGNLEISFALPNELKSEQRSFYIMNIHKDDSGKYTTDYQNAEYDNETGICTFKANKFSTYAICYEDTSLQNDKQSFATYKTDKCNQISKLVNSLDGKECKKLVSDAKKKINETLFNMDISLEENKKI